jgi:hypothetical protein
MHFQIGSRDFVAEAKFRYSGATSSGSDVVPPIKKLLYDARKEASRLEANGQRRLAIVFITPYFKGNFKRADEKIRAVPCSAKAWVFPKASRWLRSDGGKPWRWSAPNVSHFLNGGRRMIASTLLPCEKKRRLFTCPLAMPKPLPHSMVVAAIPIGDRRRWGYRRPPNGMTFGSDAR